MNRASGFDNIADVLSLSPALLDRYVSSARKISRLAVGDPSIRAVVETYPVSPMLWQDERMDDDLPFGSRGGIAIRHTFPLDGEYIIKVRLQRTGGGARLRAERADLEVRVDGVRVKRVQDRRARARSKSRPTRGCNPGHQAGP